MLINNRQVIHKTCIDRRSNAGLTLGSESDINVVCDTAELVEDTATGRGFQITKWPAVMQ